MEYKAMGYEIEVVHVAVEAKLKANGWAYEREVVVSRNGHSRADFVACASSKEACVIECKRNCEFIGNAIYQVLRYAYLILPVVTDDNREWRTRWRSSFRDDRYCWSELVLQIRRSCYLTPMIIVPRFSVTDEARELCAEYNVGLGFVDTPKHAQLNLPLD